jgi:hypothetical protein
MAAHGARVHVALRLVAIVALVGAIVAVAGTGVALELAPAGLLVLALLFGRYPGERVIQRLARPVATVRAIRRIFIPRAPRSLGARVAALALPGAGRAPPVGALI